MSNLVEPLSVEAGLVEPGRVEPLAGVVPGERLPRLDAWDSTLSLLADPYRFIGKTCRALGSPVFETRLMLQRTVCLSGARAAELFYDRTRFQRAGAAPEPLRATLFGNGGVQTLDGAAHRQRKAFFMRATEPQQVQRLVERVRQEWEAGLRDWSTRGAFSLYDAVQPVLTRAVCAWAGVRLLPGEAERLGRQLVLLFDGAASGPWRHLMARWARLRCEAWLARRIEAARAGQAVFAPGSTAEALALRHSDDAAGVTSPGRDAGVLPARVAAVELLNLLRPTVAVSVYIVFIAHALERHPVWKRVLGEPGTGAEALAFVQEVRRHSPFFPAVAARVVRDFEWDGLHFPTGRRTLLDLYGTCHDPAVWGDPERFRPERWHDRRPGRYEFMPQGGGDAATGHRCPGEDVAVQLMLLALQMLLRRMHYEVPPQDLRIRMNRLPALPADRFVIERVRRA